MTISTQYFLKQQDIQQKPGSGLTVKYHITKMIDISISMLHIY